DYRYYLLNNLIPLVLIGLCAYWFVPSHPSPLLLEFLDITLHSFYAFCALQVFQLNNLLTFLLLLLVTLSQLLTLSIIGIPCPLACTISCSIPPDISFEHIHNSSHPFNISIPQAMPDSLWFGISSSKNCGKYKCGAIGRYPWLVASLHQWIAFFTLVSTSPR